MAELPGWDRRRLRSSDPADVEAARLIVFTRAVRPILEVDVDRELDLLRRETLSPRARERAEDADRRRRREALEQLRRDQASIRRALLLDDEEPADG